MSDFSDFSELNNVDDIEITDANSTTIDITVLKPNPYQPRLKDKESIAPLVESIKKHGLLQPIVVNQDNIIVAGHRRYYSHLELGMKTIMCIRVYTTKKSLYDLALTENEERENLTDIERALSYKLALDDDIYEEQKDLAAALNKSNSHVTKMLNLLKLPDEIIADIQTKRIKPSVETLNSIMKINDKKLMIETYERYIKGEINRKDVSDIAKKQKVKVEKAIVKVARNKLKVEYDLKGLDKEKQVELEEEIQGILDKFISSSSTNSAAAIINLVVASGIFKFIA